MAAHHSDSESRSITNRQDLVQLQVPQERRVQCVDVQPTELDIVHLARSQRVSSGLEVVPIGGFPIVVAKSKYELELWAAPGKFEGVALRPGSCWGLFTGKFHQSPSEPQLSCTSSQTKLRRIGVVLCTSQTCRARSDTERDDASE